MSGPARIMRRGRWSAMALCLALCLALGTLLTACKPPQQGQTVLRFWAMGREGEVVKELLPGFALAHPEIRVEVQQMPWLSAQEKLLTAFAGDVTPDLCQLGNTWIPQFAALDAIDRLDGRVAASATMARADYFPGIWDSNRLDGALYGIPWYVDTRLLFYRKDLLAEAGFNAPPATWAEWSRMLAALKARSGPQRFGVLLPVNEFEPLLVLALQQDAPLLRDGGRYGNFRGPAFRRTLQYYLDMFHQQWAPSLSNNQISNVWDEFGRGYFTFYISGPWNIGEFKRRLPAAQQGNWMTAPMPGPDGPGASTAGGSSLVVFKRSTHKEAAWQLIEYLSQPAVQRQFNQLTGNLPPRRSAWDTLAGDVYARAFRDQLERAKSPPKVPEWERIATEMRLVTEALVGGKMTLDDAVTELDARTDRILEKRRWLLQREAKQ
jgi:multiple sugar transport system substrate-binding protein